MTKTEKTTLNSVEKDELSQARSNISKWANSNYLCGGATARDFSSRADEDLILAKELNKSTKLVSSSKLDTVIKNLRTECDEQAMYQDNKTLRSLSNDIKKLA